MGEVCVGISFGTANCCIAVYRDETAHVIPDSQGYRSTPSYIAFTAAGVLIGRTARDQLSCNSLNTVHSFKPLLGRKFSDLVTTLNFTQLPYQVVPAPGDTALIVVTNEGKEQRFSPDYLCELLLRHLKHIAETYLGTPVSQATISVPFFFTDSQRQALRDSSMRAGLKALRLITESSAACIAYGLNEGNNTEKIPVIVVNIGAGGITITALVIEEGIFEVLGVEYDGTVGGEAIDRRLVEFCIKELKRNWGVSLSEMGLKSLQLECQSAKCRLSSQSQVTIFSDSHSIPLSRSLFDQLNQDLYTRCSALVTRVLSTAHFSRNAIQHVVLAGGGARIPAFQRLLANTFPACEVCRSIVPEEVVVCGVAVQGAVLTRISSPSENDLIIMDVCPLSSVNFPFALNSLKSLVHLLT